MSSAEAKRMTVKIRLILLGAILLVLGFSLYRATLEQLAFSVLHREGSSHGIFVPFISAFFLWTRWSRLKSSPVASDPALGTAVALLGLAVFFLSKDSPDIAFSAGSFVVVSAGLVLCLLGKRIFKHAAFPLFFLLAMIPLPEGIYLQIANTMKEINTAGSVWLVKTFGVPVYREGYTIFLPELTLLVAPSCSGVRYLLSYFVFGLAYAFFFKESLPGRLAVVVATLPLSIVAGVLRLSTIFLAAHHISPTLAEHRPHVVISWAVFTALLALGVATDRIASAGLPSRKKRNAVG